MHSVVLVSMVMEKYTAKLYFDNEEVDERLGDDIDALYHWLITSAAGKFGNFNGKIIDNNNHQIIKTFCNRSPE